jgi:hypothetical protein
LDPTPPRKTEDNIVEQNDFEMQQRFKILDDSNVFEDLSEEAKWAIFTVVKYTFTICDPDWAMSGSIEYDDIKELLILGKNKDALYAEIYK